MANKTVQALKITATWTPGAAAEKKMLAVFAKTEGSILRINGGQLRLKAAIKADFGDARHGVLVHETIGKLMATLEATGTLASFNVVAGAVDADAAHTIIVKEPKEEDGETETVDANAETERQGREADERAATGA